MKFEMDLLTMVKEEMNMEKNGPVEKFREGAWEVAVWKRKNKGQNTFNLGLSRSYKKGEIWYDQKISLFENDVERCISLLRQGKEYIDSESA